MEDRGYEEGVRFIDEETYELHKECDAFSRNYCYENSDVERLEKAAKKLLDCLRFGLSTLDAEEGLKEALK
jgi:hypothetical protein